MAKPSKLRLLLLPILAPIFLIGWALAHTGQNQKPTKKRLPAAAKTTVHKDLVEIGVLAEEDQQQVVTN